MIDCSLEKNIASLLQNTPTHVQYVMQVEEENMCNIPFPETNYFFSLGSLQIIFF